MMSTSELTSAAAAPADRVRIAPVWLIAGASLLLHVAWNLLADPSLHVDEAQYWDWSRDWQWGYHSKPPGIAVLIGLSTRLFGDGELGLRLLTMACYPAAAAVLAGTARRIAAADPGGAAADAAGSWAAAIFLCSPLVALLGSVATTDGPLLLCWSVAQAALWNALGANRLRPWLLLGAACAAGVLCKYTFLAFPAGVALLVAVHGGARDRLGLAAALALGAALLLPHLAWSSGQGWVTVRHTVDITVGAPATTRGLGGPLFVVAQLLLFVPLALPVVAVAWREAHVPRHALPFLAWTTAPLLLAGVVQAAYRGAEVNWIAPVQLGGALALGLAAARLQPVARKALAVALLAQGLAATLLLLAPTLVDDPARRLPASLDIWARMRGWPAALGAVSDRVNDGPAASVVLVGRTLSAQAAYHWRGERIRRYTWPYGVVPSHHYESACPWRAAPPDGRALWVLSEGPPPAALEAALGPLDPVEHIVVPVNRSRSVELVLMRTTAHGSGGAPCR